jgi:hypothetical protein
MSITVDPALLVQAAAVAQQASIEVRPAKGVGQSAEAQASLIHYQPAAGMAEAVARKAAWSLEYAGTVLGKLTEGLTAAAAHYRRADALGSGQHIERFGPAPT